MGYQESFITTRNKKDFPKLIEAVSKLEEYHDGACIGCDLLIEVKKGFDYDCGRITKGTKFLYAVGERYYQRNVEEFLDTEETGFYVPLDVIFCEYMPLDILFSNEEQSVYPDLENEYIKVSKFEYKK